LFRRKGAVVELEFGAQSSFPNWQTFVGHQEKIDAIFASPTAD
jgi:hypothetical protein